MLKELSQIICIALALLSTASHSTERSKKKLLDAAEEPVHQIIILMKTSDYPPQYH